MFMLKYNIDLNGKTILVTGAAGFIGSNLCKRLLNETNATVVGIDNVNDYYDVNIKEYRLDELNGYDHFIFYKEDISNKEFMHSLFEKWEFEYQ